MARNVRSLWMFVLFATFVVAFAGFAVAQEAKEGAAQEKVKQDDDRLPVEPPQADEKTPPPVPKPEAEEKATPPAPAKPEAEEEVKKQDEKPEQPKGEFKKEDAKFPYIAEVTGENVNVRLKPSKENKDNKFMALLKKGDNVTVVGEEGDFSTILAPRGSYCWVHSKSVKMSGESDGEVTADDVPLRIDATLGADKIGLLKKGDTVKVVSTKMEWLKVEAPESCRFYIAKKYITPVAQADVAKVPPQTVDPTVKPPKTADQPKKTPVGAPKATAEDAEAIKLLAEAKKAFNEEITKMSRSSEDIKKANFDGVEAMLQKVIETAKTDPVKKEAQELSDKVRSWKAILKLAATGDQKLIDIQNEIERLKNPAAQRVFDFEGWVEGTGKWLINRPGTHKLVEGGKPVCFLTGRPGKESEMEEQLNQYLGQRVGVKGEIIVNPSGWSGHKLVIVDEVVLLSK